jgi:hypothetical protein
MTVGDDVVLSAGAFTAVASPGGIKTPAERSGSSWASIAAQGMHKPTSPLVLREKDQSQVPNSGMKNTVEAATPPGIRAETQQPAAALVSAQESPATQRQVADAEEIEKLRREIQHLRLQAASMEASHQQELADVLQDAARHETAAVAAAVREERMGCVVRFASLLQSNNVVLASVMPTLLAGAAGQSLQSTDSLSTFMNNNTNDNYGFDDRGDTLLQQPQPFFGFERTTEQEAMNLYENQTARNFVASTRMSPSPMAPSRTKAIPTSSVSCDIFGVGSTPLSTSPFSFEVGEGLRGEYLDNHSAFLVPANEPDTHLLGQTFFDTVQRKTFGSSDGLAR